MAGLTKRPGGRFWVQFRRDSKAFTIRLGPVAKRDAESIRAKVSTLVDYSAAGLALPADVAAWVGSAEGSVLRVLQSAGLAGSRDPSTIGAMVDAQLERSVARSKSTLANYRLFGSSLTGYFGAERDARSISPADAARYRSTLFAGGARSGAPLAEATVSTRLRFARNLFARVVTSGLLAENPFAALCGLSERNPERDRYIPRSTIEAAIDATVDVETRALFALARYAGLRIPSEIRGLCWAAVDQERGVLRIRAPKLNYRGAAAFREVPIFPEVQRELLELWDRVPDGTELVLSTLAGVSSAALSDRLQTALRKIGLPIWPKPWVNLRASCERDLLEEHSIDVVAAWLGHSAATALTHYSRVDAACEAGRAACASSTSGERRRG